MPKTYVTQPSLPPLDDFLPYIKKIWENKQLTNGGPFHHEFEVKLSEYLNVKHLSLFTNGTLALVTALQALRITGEVITTPYTFPATVHALWWNNIKPVFADIDSMHFNLNVRRIEEAISPQTTAILPVHVYGHPCNTDGIQKIADNYGLKVIYDAAHTFGVLSGKQSLCSMGDLSILSFHATKVFNTFEGGAIICPDLKTKKRIDYLKNFGFVNETTVVAPGINGKMNEFQAALGLLQLDHIDENISKRQSIDALYRDGLVGVDGISCVSVSDGTTHNYAYFPILVEQEYAFDRDGLYEMLKSENIFARRYFYPLISDLPMYRGLDSSKKENLPVARSVSSQILCLPIYPSLQINTVKRIIDIIAKH